MSDGNFDDPDFGDPDYGYKPPRDGMSGCAKLALGCGAIIFVGVIAAVIGIWWVAANARNLAADAAAAGMKGGSKSSICRPIRSAASSIALTKTRSPPLD